MQNLIIANVSIRQFDGLYSLNDLRDAAVESGITKDIRPNEWLSLEQTKGLAEILITEKPGNKPIDSRAGRYGGTYVAKELVYAYAMWISPKFNLKVIRAFDSIATGAASLGITTDELLARLGGVMKSVSTKQHEEFERRMLAQFEERLSAVQEDLDSRVNAVIAMQQIGVRHGVTAGQVWSRHGLPKLKNGPQMLSRLLIKEKCAIEGGGRAEIGGKTAKLFDPDKSDAMMKYKLLANCQRYVQERESQIAINFEHHRKTEAKIKEIVTSMAGL